MKGNRDGHGFWPLLLAALVLTPAAWADPPVTVERVSGSRLSGKLVSVRDGTLTLRTDAGTTALPMSEVKRIIFTAAPPPPKPSSGGTPAAGETPKPVEPPSKPSSLDALCKQLLTQPPLTVLARVRELAAGPRRSVLRQATKRLAKESEAVAPESAKAKSYNVALACLRVYAPVRLTEAQRAKLRQFNRAHSSDEALRGLRAELRKAWEERQRRQPRRRGGARRGGRP